MTAPRNVQARSKPPTDWVLAFAKAFLTPGIRRWIRKQRRPGRFQRLLRPSDVFIIGHPKSGNTWLAYMLAIVLTKDTQNQITLSNVGKYVPYIHGEDWRIEEYWTLPNPRVFRNECPNYPEFYPRKIYLIRDPRAVLVSFYHMYRVMLNDFKMSIESFLDQYLATDGVFKHWNCGLQRWDRQVLAWTQQAQYDSNVLLIKYEELLLDRGSVLKKALNFAGAVYEEADLSLTVSRGSFEAMRSNEQTFGAEAYQGEAGRRGWFIRRGEANGWKQDLTQDVIQKIEYEFGPTMRTCGYL